MTNYSQNDEQAHILAYFKAHPPKFRSFLDIGAHDGKTFSNTFALASMGWQGHYVEADYRLAAQIIPNIARFTKLPGARPAAVIRSAFAARTAPWRVEFWKSRGGGDFYGTTDPRQVDKFKSITEFEKTSVPTVTIDGLSGPYDFISLDVEGQNLELLPELAPRLKDCQLVCVEHDGNDIQMLAMIASYGGPTEVKTRNAENLIVGRE